MLKFTRKLIEALDFLLFLSMVIFDIFVGVALFFAFQNVVEKVGFLGAIFLSIITLVLIVLVFFVLFARYDSWCEKYYEKKVKNE